MIWIVLLVALGWFLWTALATWNLASTPLLPTLEQLGASRVSPRGEPPENPSPQDGPPPADERPLERVSVIIAARDEAARIEESVRRLLAQEGVELQLIVVDDRSTDATPEILARLGAEDPRLTVARVDSLPPDWLGKCHACHRGSQLATAPWLLFCDGDAHLSPDAIARAVGAARRDAADHLTLWPGLTSEGPLVRASVMAWGQCLAMYCQTARINRDNEKGAIGVGAFNLIRRDAYQKLGGHEALRMEVVDDVKLGRLVRRFGFRTRLYGGFREVEVEWARSSRELLRLVEKNWFAGVGYSLPRSLAVQFGMLAMWLIAALGPLLAPGWGWMGVAGLMAPALPGLAMAYGAGWPVWTGLLTPLGYLTFIAAGANSTWKTMRQGGIRWRDTFYPLDDLRRGLVE